MYAIQFVGRGPDAEALAINMSFLEVIGLSSRTSFTVTARVTCPWRFLKRVRGPPLLLLIFALVVVY